MEFQNCIAKSLSYINEQVNENSVSKGLLAGPSGRAV